MGPMGFGTVGLKGTARPPHIRNDGVSQQNHGYMGLIV